MGESGNLNPTALPGVGWYWPCGVCGKFSELIQGGDGTFGLMKPSPAGHDGHGRTDCAACGLTLYLGEESPLFTDSEEIRDYAWRRAFRPPFGGRGRETAWEMISGLRQRAVGESGNGM